MARLTARERREAYLREYELPEEDGQAVLPAGDPARHHRQPLLRAADRRARDRLALHGETARTSGILGPLYEDKADSAVAIYDPRPDWYYFFLFQLLRIFDNPNLLLLGTIIIPTIWMGHPDRDAVHRPLARAPRVAPPDRDRASPAAWPCCC